MLENMQPLLQTYNNNNNNIYFAKGQVQQKGKSPSAGNHATKQTRTKIFAVNNILLQPKYAHPNTKIFFTFYV